MRKPKTYLFCGYTALLLATAVAIGGLLVRHEPNFYRTREVDPGPERKQLSTKFGTDFMQMVLNVKGGGAGGWHFAFTEKEINSFFQEDFVTSGEVENLRKLGITEPRVAFEDDCIRLAFRWGSGFWSTILSYDLRVWTVAKEPNVLAVEIRGRRIGGLPVSSQALLTEMTELAARHNIELTAYRHEGRPVAVLRFQADQIRPSAQLKCLRIKAGELTIGGICPAPACKATVPAAN